MYAHALLVLDDTDFYERQDTFTLPQQRGIATALNALVFRSYCPTVSGEPHPTNVLNPIIINPVNPNPYPAVNALVPF